MATISLLYKTSAHIRFVYTSNPREEFTYHNLAHTEEVVRVADLIAGHEQLPEADYLALLIAAWFHDVGYLFATEEHHVEKSVDMATAFLEKENASPELIARVQRAIMATKMPQQPTCVIGRILADADLFHFGTPNFEKTDKQVKEETELRIKQVISDDVWNSIGLKLLEKHQFHTIYCQHYLKEGKRRNLDRLQALQLPLTTQQLALQESDSERNGTNEKSPSKPKKEKKPTRGVETMFRLTAANQMHLSDMADNKAHILLTINSVIVSVIVSFLFRKLAEEPRFLVPAILFLITSLVTLVSAIMVTRPEVSKSKFTGEDVQKRKVNLLFFGNYYKLRYEDYEYGVKDMMGDKDYLYSSLIKDNFNLGIVLEKKYRKLRFAYGFFMFGFVISVISFLLAELFFIKSL